MIAFRRATKPLVGMLAGPIAGGETYGVDPELQRYLRDVQDHAIQVQEQVTGIRELPQNVLSVNLTIAGLPQNDEAKELSDASIEPNEEVKRISAWAAILFVPTRIGTVDGMNFHHMPELHRRYGSGVSLLPMFLVSAAMGGAFKRRGWLG